LEPKQNIGLVAHDNKKKDLVEWVAFNKDMLSVHNLYATGTTGQRIIDKTGLKITLFKSGPYGGDMELGALIANGRLDYLIFFWDPLQAHPHDVDVKALLRVSGLVQCTDCLQPCDSRSDNFKSVVQERPVQV